MPKKTTHPLIMELALGKSVEEVIQGHFSGYTLSDFARSHLARLIREIVELDNKALRFAVRLDLNKSSQEPVVRLISYTCPSTITLDYTSRDHASAQPDCVILNDIVRRLYGINKKDPKATQTHGFVKTTSVGIRCFECGQADCPRYEQILIANNYRFRYRIAICQRCNSISLPGLSKTWLGG